MSDKSANRNNGLFKLTSPQHGNKFTWRLAPGTYVAGRDPQADLVINDSTVSRKHARLVIMEDQTVRLTDLGSLNGTQVNDKRVTDTVDLKVGDTISFGNIGFLLMHEGIPETRPQSVISQVSIVDDKGSHTSISAIPLEQALAPLPAKDTANPAIFKAIADMAKMLILPQSVDEMFNQALDLLGNVVHAERSAIFAADEVTGEVSLLNYRIANKTSSEQFVISRTIVKEVLNKKNAVFFSDLISDERFARQESIVVSGIRSVMAIPMVDEDKVMGILYLDTTDPSHRYSEDTLKLVATFGNILAAKITNHNLLKERQEKQALESELSIASQIQEGLMPKILPQVPGYNFHAFQMQCKMVGGDLYDVAQLADGRILFLLADVSGKGMGAALLASNILSAFRMLRGMANFDCADATARVSEQLAGTSRGGDFATVFLAVLDPAKNSLQFVNAGHNPPLLVKTDGTHNYLDSTGIPIGIFGGFAWTQSEITIEAGDRIWIFTDGIPEAHNVEAELYSDERLEKFLTESRKANLPEATEALIGDVSKFVGEAPRSDDITLLVLQRN